MDVQSHTFKTPLEKRNLVELALIKIPKSLELFELYLHQIYLSSTSETEVICAFMTKHFSTSIIKIASKYFEDVSQTRAWKKARLMILKNPKILRDQGLTSDFLTLKSLHL